MRSIVALLILSAVALASAANNNIFLNNAAGFSLQVTGNQNVPKFEFWYKNGTHYFVRLQSLFEATPDLSKVPASQLALPSLTWAFSAITTEDNETMTFNVTASGAEPRFTSLVFRFHLGAFVTFWPQAVFSGPHALIHHPFTILIVSHTFLSTSPTCKPATASGGILTLWPQKTFFLWIFSDVTIFPLETLPRVRHRSSLMSS
jgi:hypothetical protein